MKKNNLLILSHDFFPKNIWGTGKNVYDFIEAYYHNYDIVLYTSLPRKSCEKFKIICPNDFLYKTFLKGNFIENNSYRDSDMLFALNVLMIKNIQKYYEKIGVKPDLILNHGWMTFDIAEYFSKKYGVKIISFVHFFEKQFFASNNTSTKSDWNDIFDIENKMFNNSFQLVVFTDNQKNILPKLYNFNKDKIVVIPHSIKLPKIKYCKKDEDKIKILFVGRLIKDKGIIELVNVFKKLKCKYSNLELNIVGDGVLKSYLYSLNIEGVNVLGYLEGNELYSNYLINDIFCLPSKTETFGLVLLEAMNYKIPILTTEGESVSNVIENEVTGLTIKLKKDGEILYIDENELYLKLERLILNKDLRFDLSNKAYKNYLKTYANNEYVKIEKLIKEVINE